MGRTSCACMIHVLFTKSIITLRTLTRKRSSSSNILVGDVLDAAHCEGELRVEGQHNVEEREELRVPHMVHKRRQL